MKKAEGKIVLGIDPGFGRIGFGCLGVGRGAVKCLGVGAITTSSKDEFSSRLCQLADDLGSILKKYQPDLVAVEKLFFAKNTKTAMQVSEARGVILSIIAKNKIKLCEFTPAQIKKAVTGDGKADKKAVEKMICLLLGLKKSPRLDDASDALAIALTAASLADR